MTKWILLVFALLPFCLGFRSFPGGNQWSISVSDPTIWVKFCRLPTFEKSEIPSEDVLNGSTINATTVMQSMFDDYNRVSGSFARLAFYPDDPANPPAPASGDSTFTTSKASRRTISVCFNDQVLTGGYTKQKWDDEGVSGCEIQISNAQTKSAKEFLRVMTHEVGHCFGLDHPQESVHAVMSYYAPDQLRLAIDDKMGMTYLYPRDSSYGKETPTLGLSCSTK